MSTQPSIIRFIDEYDLQVPTTLIYSASAPSELLFRDEFEAIAARNSNFRTHFTVTQPRNERWDGHIGRIDNDAFRASGVNAHTLCYICGPPEMIQVMLISLKELGVLEERLRYEQWW